MRWITFPGAFLAALLLVTLSAAEELKRGPFIVDYDTEDEQTAQDTLTWLEDAQAEFQTGLPLGDEPVRVRIAANMNEFLGLSGTYAHVGVSGVTRAAQSQIALKSPRLRDMGDDYRGTVRHELVHVLLHRNTNTHNLPRWLNEGICMMLANELRWESSLQVAKMHLSGQLMPMPTLERAFAAPGSDHQFGNAYAQALSMTRHLRDEIGDQKFWALVIAMKEGSFDTAMIETAGVTSIAFWDDYQGGLWGLTVISVLRTGSFWGAISLLCILTFLVRHWRNRAIVRRWAEEDEDFEEDEPFDWDSILADGDDWKQ